MYGEQNCNETKISSLQFDCRPDLIKCFCFPLDFTIFIKQKEKSFSFTHSPWGTLKQKLFFLFRSAVICLTLKQKQNVFVSLSFRLFGSETKTKCFCFTQFSVIWQWNKNKMFLFRCTCFLALLAFHIIQQFERKIIKSWIVVREI